MSSHHIPFSGSLWGVKDVYLVKLPPLYWHLLHDVLGVEDGLEVEPALLTAQPRVEDVLRYNNSNNDGNKKFDI